MNLNISYISIFILIINFGFRVEVSQASESLRIRKNLEMLVGQMSILDSLEEVELNFRRASSVIFKESNEGEFRKIKDLSLLALERCPNVRPDMRSYCVNLVWKNMSPFLGESDLRLSIEKTVNQVPDALGYKVFLCLVTRDNKCLLEYIKKHKNALTLDLNQTELFYSLLRAHLTLGTRETARKYLARLREAALTLEEDNRLFATVYYLQSLFLMQDELPEKEILQKLVLQSRVPNGVGSRGLLFFQISSLNRSFRGSMLTNDRLNSLLSDRSTDPVERVWFLIEKAFSLEKISNVELRDLELVGSRMMSLPLKTAIDFFKSQSNGTAKQFEDVAKSNLQGIFIYEYQLVLREILRINSQNTKK